MRYAVWAAVGAAFVTTLAVAAAKLAGEPVVAAFAAGLGGGVFAMATALHYGLITRG